MTSTLRRYQRMKPSRGTTWPKDESDAIYARDKGRCVGPLAGMPGTCEGPVERDHVRASGGLGMKSASTAANGVLLCSNVHHPMKTREGRKYRPLLLDYIVRSGDDHEHVELVHGCTECDVIRRRLA